MNKFINDWKVFEVSYVTKYVTSKNLHKIGHNKRSRKIESELRKFVDDIIIKKCGGVSFKILNNVDKYLFDYIVEAVDQEINITPIFMNIGDRNIPLLFTIKINFDGDIDIIKSKKYSSSITDKVDEFMYDYVLGEDAFYKYSDDYLMNYNNNDSNVNFNVLDDRYTNPVLFRDRKEAVKFKKFMVSDVNLHNSIKESIEDNDADISFGQAIDAIKRMPINKLYEE